MKQHLLFLLLLLAYTIPAAANDSIQVIKTEADTAYVRQEYDRAAELYLQLAAEGYDARLCYNLGCAYYRLDSIAKSILWFERGLLLAPDDADMRYNLALVRDHTIDRIIPRHEMLFATLYRTIVNGLSLQKWAVLGILCFALSLISLALYFYSTRMSLRKVGFCLCFLFLLWVIGANVCAFQQRSYRQHRTKAVVVASAVSVRSTPSTGGNELFVIHEGTCVEVEDDTMREWVQVRIADGKVGWIEKSTTERI